MKLRLLRLSASPHSIAAGVAIGIAVAWTPFLGVHIIIALAIAFILRAWRTDKIASLLFVPYALWVTVAMALNGALILLN